MFNWQIKKNNGGSKIIKSSLEKYIYESKYP